MHRVAHRSFEVRESSQPGEVRRAAAQLAKDLGFDEVATGRVALVATELASNLVKHAVQGRMLVAPVRAEDGAAMVELLSLDSGPGIANLAGSLADGFSTGGTSGTGLGAVRRLSAQFDAYSQPGAGTVIFARVAATSSAATPVVQTPKPPFLVGAVALCAPGETACGDAWDVMQRDGRIALMVADGLGHGPHAAEASTAATAVFLADPLAAPSQVLGRAHTRLKTTRGAAVAMAQVDGEQETLVFCGVGNIVGRIVSGVTDRTLLSQNGTAGLQIRTVQDMSHAFAKHSLLVMHSDGIASRWNLHGVPGLLQQHPSLVAAWLVRDHCRGRDDATVVVVRRRA